MAGTGRPGRPKGSKNKPRVTSTSAPNADTLSASSSLDTGRLASSTQPSNTPPVLPRSSLPPSVLASLERPSVTNYARNHPIFSDAGKVSEKKYLKEVKAFASAKNINEDFVNSCVGEAKRLLEERKTDSATSAKDMGGATARPDVDHGPEKKPKKHKKKDSSEQDTATPVIKQEQLEEPVKEKKKKYKKKDELSASVSTQDFAVKQESEEPVAEHERPKKHKKKQKASESAALTHEEPANHAEDADGKKAKKHKKGKTSESAGESASAANSVFIKPEEPSTEGKSSKKKHKPHAEVKSADVSERRPTETPIPLPTTGKSEARKDPGETVSKSKPSKKRKRDQSDDESTKPAPDEAETSNVGHVPKKKKKHEKSGHESDSRTTEGKKDKKKKHKTHQASRSPSPPPRKKTKRVQHDGETAHLASEAPQSSHKSHEHADKGKEKKGKKTKEPGTSEASRPGPSKSAALSRDMAPEVSKDERPTQTEGDAHTPRSSKKKHKKERRKSKHSESLETQSAQPSNAVDVESGPEKLGADHEAQSEKHLKKARSKSTAAQEALAALPFASAQDSPAKPSKSGLKQHESKPAKFLPPPAPPKRKRSPSPPSDEETRPRDARKASLASTSSVFSLPTLTRFANDSLMFPEPPEGMSTNAKKRWRKKLRKSMRKLPNDARPFAGSGVDSSAPQKAPTREEAAKSDNERNSGKRPDRKKAKVEHDPDAGQHENDAASKVPAVLEKPQASTSQDATVHQPALKRPQVTATGSFAHEEPFSPISSPERPTSAHEQKQDLSSEEASVAEPITQKPHVNATGSLAHNEPLPTVSSPERPASVHETPAPPAASESPLKSDTQGWDALPAQYLSDSDQEAQEASDVEPDTPVKAAEPLQPQQTGDEDANTESSKNSESESESESDSESEAEGPFKPRPLPPHLLKTPSQISTPSKRPLPQPASLQAQPLLTLSQLKASTPTLTANTRAAVPLKPKTPPKANGNVDILGIPHGTDESDEESSGSSSSSDDDDDDRKTNVKANATKPASLHFPSSQPGRLFAKPKTPPQGNSVPAIRKLSAAPKMATAKAEQPLADNLSGDAGSGDGDESGSASSDDGNDNGQEVAVNGKKTTPPHAESSQETKVNGPGNPPAKWDEPRKDDLGMGLRPQESDDEASSESESDGEENGTWASTNQNPVSHQSQSSQRIKLESPQSSLPASRSPRQVSSLPDSQPDEPTKDDAQVDKHSDQTESEDEGDAHVTIEGANDTAAELQSADGQPEETGQENSMSSSSSDAEDPTPFESALQTPAQHPSPAPSQQQLNDSVGDASRSPLANDIINGIALSGSKKASSVEHDGPQRETSSADSEAHEPQVNHSPATDKGMEAETLPDADGESLKSAEKSNHNHGSSTNFGEPDSPSIDSSTNSHSVLIKQSHSSPTRTSPQNDDLDMGQEISAFKLEDISIPAGPPPVENEGAVASNSPPRPLRSRSKRLRAREQADALAESQRIMKSKSPKSLRNESGQFHTIERSASPVEGEGLVKSNSPLRPLRNEIGKFCKKDGSTRKTERNRKPSTKTPRLKRNKQSVLRELGIDPGTIKAEEQNAHSPIMTRGSQRSPAEDSRESPISSKGRRLRATPRVSYQDGYDSSESVTKTTARRLSFTSNKTRSHTRRLSSSQRSRPSPSPQFDGNLAQRVKTPSKTRSELVGVFIPPRRPSPIRRRSKSVTSLDLRDGKSAKQQDEDVVASTADADQANDEDLAREPATPPSPSEGVRDDDSATDDKSAHEEEAPQDHDTAEDEHDRDKGYESSPSVYQSPERPVFTASLPAHAAPEAVSTDDNSTSEHEGEVDDAESEATQFDSIQSDFARQGSPVHDKQDSGLDENGKDLVPSPEAEIESQAPDQDERQEDFEENGLGESQESSDEEKVSEAASRGSDYSFDDEPNGFVNEDGTVSGQATPRRSTGLRSNHFSPAKPARPAAGTARLKFPSTTADTFGLIQENLCHDPFRLFVATMLLNVTNGEKAVPKFWEIMEKYPTVHDITHANLNELTGMIKPLGLQARRAEKMIKLASFFITDPPTMGIRYRVMNYPFKSAHRDIRPGEVISDDDPRVAAFEVSHLPGVGPYAIDSWRIFCRDQLRGKSSGFNGEDAEPGFEPEWKRVHPNDKELKGFIRWMWLREGWLWDPETGEKKRTSEDEALAARLARLRWDQKKGEAYILPGDDEEDQAPNGSLSREEGNGPGERSNENAQAPQADSVPPSHVSSPADNPSSQLEREQRNRAAQSQLAQAKLLHEEQQQRLTMSQPRPSTAYGKRTPKAKDPNGSLSTAPATLPTRLRRTTTTATTSTSSSPVSAHRPKPTPLDLFSDDDDDSASNLGLRSLFRTPRRRRGSSPKWAASGVVDETPPVSPRREGQQQDRTGDKTAHDNHGEQDMDNFSVFGDDDDQDHDQKDTVKVNGNGMNGHREVGDDHGNNDDEGKRLAPVGLHEDEADVGHVEEHEEQEKRSPPGVVNEPITGDGSQESNKSCRVM